MSDGGDLEVLFHTYDWAFQRPGGGEVQLLQTRRRLQAMGVKVTLFERWRTHLADYPLVHSFSLIPNRFWAPVKHAGCALAVSPIDWPFAPPRSLRFWAKQKAIGIAERLLRFRAGDQPPPFEQVDLFFPNSQREADLLCQAYKIPPERMHVVPNGVEERFAEATPEAFVQRYGLRDFVLCVGRIEPRKNQLGLIRALRGVCRPIVFIGEATLGSEEYAAACRQEAGSNAHFLGRLDHASPLLASAYAAAGVLALPSEVETPGLCALEAALAGAPVVITEVGSAREYFGQHALYVHPTSADQIRAATLRMLADPPDPAPMRQRIQARYLWQHTAKATLAGYHKLLAARQTRT